VYGVFINYATSLASASTSASLFPGLVNILVEGEGMKRQVVCVVV